MFTEIGPAPGPQKCQSGKLQFLVITVLLFAPAIASPAQTLTTLAYLTKSNTANPVYAPQPLFQGSDGNFYGTTSAGGGNTSNACAPGFSCGSVFKVTPTGVLTTLYSFCSKANCTDGLGPNGGLVQAADGNFYGTTTAGGGNASGSPCLSFYSTSTCGTIFKITPAGVLTTLHVFCSRTNSQHACLDGAVPQGPLIQASDGNLYGTTQFGGTNFFGTVFRITPEGSLTTIYSFTGLGDGAQPTTGLVQAADGNLYGVAPGRDCRPNQAPQGCPSPGGVFKIMLDGTETVISPGIATSGGLLQASDGNLYAPSELDGVNGSILRITLQGTVTRLHSFNGTDGRNPVGPLIQAADGNLYGTTPLGGVGGGTIFQITLGGTFTTLHSLLPLVTDGACPYSGVIQAADGSLYGTTNGAGYQASNPYGYGTVFRLSLGTRATTTALASSTNPSAANQGVTFTAGVTGLNGTPTGVVSFQNGANILGNATLENGQAIFTKIFPSNGTPAITAVFSGDSNYAGSTSAVLQGVGGNATTTTLTSNLNPALPGQFVGFTATVSSTFGSPTGSVTFMNGGVQTLGTVALSGGRAILNYDFVNPNAKSITAVYSGDTSFAASVSPALSEVVSNGSASSTTASLLPSLNPTAVGQSVALTATVSSTSGTPAGSVTFMNRNNAMGTVALNGGQATFNKVFTSTGTKSITVFYPGAANFAGSISPAQSEVVVPASTSTTLVSSLNPAVVGQSVVLTATVIPEFGGAPTGTVTFMNGTTAMDTVALTGGPAVFSKTFSVAGVKSVTAVYSGDANFVASTSPILRQVANSGNSGPSGRTYTTTFGQAENPISEGGNWINGGAVGLDWHDCRSIPGLAFGTQPSTITFDDTTCVLGGAWGATQTAKATVHVATGTAASFEEVELRLHTTISAHNITGYEINCSVNPTDPYLQIVRWNGALGDFTYLAVSSTGCANGDVLKATMSGTTITAFKNGVQILQATDSMFLNGAPGMGFYIQSGNLGANADFGFSNFSASD